MSEHVTIETLFAYQRDQLAPPEKTKTQKHLAACKFCAENAELITHLSRPTKAKSSVAPEATDETDIERKTACLTTDTIGMFLSGALPGAQRHTVERHLAECDGCREQLAEIFRASFAPVSDEEKLLLDSLPPLEISEQVRQIMRLMPQPKPKPDFGKLVSDWLQQFLPEPGLLRPVSAFALILLLAVVGKWWAWPTYRYFTLVQQSQSQMAEQFKIYYKGELRPAGSYHSSPIAQEMSGTSVDQPERLQTQKIDTLLRDALSYKPAGEAAQRMLTQYYLLQNRDAQADSMLKLLESSSLHVAAVLNDRGILFFHRGQYDSAAIAFERAFALNPGLDEALYNLAITQTRRGDLVAAKKSWEAYLKLEVPAEWRNAAQAQLQELEEQQMQ